MGALKFDTQKSNGPGSLPRRHRNMRGRSVVYETVRPMNQLDPFVQLFAQGPPNPPQRGEQNPNQPGSPVGLKAFFQQL